METFRGQKRGGKRIKKKKKRAERTVSEETAASTKAKAQFRSYQTQRLVSAATSFNVWLILNIFS